MRRRQLERGATAVEYAITILIVSIVLVFGTVSLGPVLGQTMDKVGTAIGDPSQSNPDDDTPADCSAAALEGADALRERLAASWSFNPHFMVAPDPIRPTAEPLYPGDSVMTLTSASAASDLKHFKDCGGDLQLRVITSHAWHVTLSCYDPDNKLVMDPGPFVDGMTWEQFQYWSFASACINGRDSQGTTRAWEFTTWSVSGDKVTFTDPVPLTEWPYTTDLRDPMADPNITNWLQYTVESALADLYRYRYEVNPPTLFSVSYQYNFEAQMDVPCTGAADECEGYDPRRAQWWTGWQYGQRYFDYPSSNYGNQNSWPQISR